AGCGLGRQAPGADRLLPDAGSAVSLGDFRLRTGSDPDLDRLPRPEGGARARKPSAGASARAETARRASLPLDAVRLAAAHVARHRAEARLPVRGGIVPDAHHRSGEPRREPHARQGYFQPCARQPRGGGLLGPAGGVAVFGISRGLGGARCYLLIRKTISSKLVPSRAPNAG